MQFDPRAAPFHLSDDDVDWVNRTLSDLSREQKLAQLINVLVMTDDPDDLAALQNLGPGSMTRLASDDPAYECRLRDAFQAAAPVPVLISADLEGSHMTQPGGVMLPNPLGLAAVDDVAATSRATEILAADAAENGVAWSFTPLLDINAAFRSAIVGTRSFGSDPDLIRRHMLAQIATLQAHGIAATAKHFPGEGFDDRDQHLVTTVNPLSLPEWENTFGRLYRDAIEGGVLSIMTGHIAFPAWVRAMGREDDAFKPGSINRHINIALLREHLGFQGLIVSDATPMAGLGAYAPRREFVAEVISEGCDVILFSPDPQQDLIWLAEAVDDGRLSMERVDDAVTRLLALKARLRLHDPVSAPPRDRKADAHFAADLHARVPTLVKDVQGLFPISPDRQRRVLIISGGIVIPFAPEPLPFVLPDMMRERGFDVSLYSPGDAITPDRFDLVLYLFGEETLLTRNNIHIDWHRLMGGVLQAMERPWHDVPTAMISFGYPYHLYDAPRVPTYVNAYAATAPMQAATLAAMMGETPWQGTSPVDPFCGLEDARF